MVLSPHRVPFLMAAIRLLIAYLVETHFQVWPVIQELLQACLTLLRQVILVL
jgi:hypothetical protein